ncbi:VOC family protein [Micromonospora psammae]|uniref:VOC family protein n=1 Tax=Micromonospora sp. CPCC 205556 TaxID=3122398 RepID=UPI002FF1446F
MYPELHGRVGAAGRTVAARGSAERAVLDQALCDGDAEQDEFLTEPKDHGVEIRCYLRDPDGYLIELGQGTGILAEMGRAAAD